MTSEYCFQFQYSLRNLNKWFYELTDVYWHRKWTFPLQACATVQLQSIRGLYCEASVPHRIIQSCSIVMTSVMYMYIIIIILHTLLHTCTGCTLLCRVLSPSQKPVRKWNVKGEVEKLLWNHLQPKHLLVSVNTALLCPLSVCSLFLGLHWQECSLVFGPGRWLHSVSDTCTHWAHHRWASNHLKH